MCEVLEVSRSGYYRWLKNSSFDEDRHADLDAKIVTSYEKSRGSYGSPRITVDLMQERKLTERKVSQSTVARRMKVLKISAKRKRKYVITTQSKHNEPIAANLLNREFSAEEPGRKWVSDLTYFPIGASWGYLTIVLDLADRAIVGWSVSENMTAQSTAEEALRRAFKNRPVQSGLIFHSDRGVQYACLNFRRLLARNHCRQSMSRKGNCWDNAVAESFFKTIKTECLNKHRFDSLVQARRVIFDYIDGWYNTIRIHSYLGGKSPAQVYRELRSSKKSA